MNPLPATTPVLIVGGGPAGLTLSLLLAGHGIASVLVDKRTSPSTLPRARGVHARAMEIARSCGVEDALRAVGLPITPGVRWHSVLSALPARSERISAAVDDDVSPCEGLAVAQDVFEEQLRAHAAGRPGAIVRQGMALTGLQAHPDLVVATLLDADGGREETFAGRPQARPSRSMRQIDMGYRYVSGAIVNDDPTGPDPDAPGSDYTPRASPGCRAPHLWLDAGRRRSTLDLFGHDFVLLSDTGAGWADAARMVGADPATPLRFHRIEAPGWAELYGVRAGSAVLVRPDGHVAWRRSRCFADAPGEAAVALKAAMRTALCAEPAPSTV